MRFRLRLKTRGRAARLTALLIVLCGVGAATYVASAAPSLPTPTITGKPADPLRSTDAVFTYTASQAGMFQCALDRRDYEPCGSGTSGSYARTVAAGSHTLKVRLQVGRQTSRSTHYSWVVDISTPSPPALKLSKAGDDVDVRGRTAYYNGTNGSGSSFTVSATAHDSRSGIQKVAFPTIGGFAGGGDDTSSPYSATYTWSSSTASGPQTVVADNGVDLTSSSTFNLVRDVTAPNSGALTVNGTAATSAGPLSLNAAGTFRIDLRSQYVEKRSTTQAGLGSSRLTRQQASLGSTGCGDFGTPTTIKGRPMQRRLPDGCYLYTLTGTDRVGNAASLRTTVVVDRSGYGLPFTIAGTVTGLQPGLWISIPVTITNPAAETLYVTSLTVAASGAPNGCDASVNVEIQASSASPSNKLAVPANAVDWPVPAAFRPQIRLKNTAFNQDNCKNQTFGLAYSGQGTNQP